MEKVLFWVDEKWRRSYTHVPLLFPFWGAIVSSTSPFQKNIYERHALNTRCFGLAPTLLQADAVLMPYRYNVLREKDPSLIAEIADTAAGARKPLLVDGTSDIEYPIPFAHAIVIRIGGYRSDPHGREIRIPIYSEDLLVTACGGALQLREKNEKAVIGFSGWSHLSLSQRAKTLVKELPVQARGLFNSQYLARRKGVLFREQALSALRHSSLIVPNIIERPSYSAHPATASADMQLLRKEFTHNLLASDYGLDVRGDANASTRLYEMLSLGRIPIIIDTDRYFPFDDEIDYASFSLRVDFRNIKKLPELVAEFHASISPEKFLDMQHAAREAYLRYFRLDAVAPHIMNRVRKHIQAMQL